MRRFAGKCACILTTDKATQFFNPFQCGVACPAGTGKNAQAQASYRGQLE